METEARGQWQQGHLLAGDVEGEQVEQIVVAAGGHDLEAAQAITRLAAVERLDGAEVDDFLEQIDQVVGVFRIVQRADTQLQAACQLRCRRRSSRCHRFYGRLRQHGDRLGNDSRRGGRGQGLPGHQRADLHQQFARVYRVTAGALVACQLRAQRVAGLQQHVDHRRSRLKLMAA